MTIKKGSTAWYKQKTAEIKAESKLAYGTYLSIRFNTLNRKLENRRRKPYL